MRKADEIILKDIRFFLWKFLIYPDLPFRCRHHYLCDASNRVFNLFADFSPICSGRIAADISSSTFTYNTFY